MSNAFILQQAPAFGPGRITAILRDFGIPVQIRKLYAGDEVPTDLEEIRLAVLLGGPMRLAEAEADADKYPFFAKQIALLHRMISVDRPVLAIGLGAQLLAQAAGAKVQANPTPEFGWHPINLPFPGGTEPIVMGLSDGSPMFHWHQDTFDVPKMPGSPPAPPGSALLCSTKACKNQAFRFKTRMFGFQFHMELAKPDIEAIVAAAPADQRPDAQLLRQETEKQMGRYTRLGDRLIRNFVQFTKTY
jgi:GMP synthase-like glutamine amidotransferase